MEADHAGKSARGAQETGSVRECRTSLQYGHILPGRRRRMCA